MREILLKEHPNWRIPERRVKKFIKRHVNRHQDPAGADDDTVTSAKVGSPVGRALRRLIKPFSSSRNVKGAPPMIIEGGDIPKTSPHPALKAPKEEAPKEEAPKPMDKTAEPVPSTTVAETVEADFQDRAVIAYEDDNIGKKDKCECNACVIS